MCSVNLLKSDIIVSDLRKAELLLPIPLGISLVIPSLHSDFGEMKQSLYPSANVRFQRRKVLLARRKSMNEMQIRSSFHLKMNVPLQRAILPACHYNQ